MPSPKDVTRDLLAGLVVFLVALPLCLGVALASNAPMFSGLLAGIVGGLVVGRLSGSRTSVSGPAAGLTAVVANQIAQLGSMEAFLLAVALAGVLQLAMGLLRAGFIASYFPSSVIKGLLAAIGLILILKQIPHLFGHDPDAMGEMAFQQPDGENTLSELLRSVFDIQPGAALIGLLSLGLLIGWNRIALLKKSGVPAPLIVVVFGVAMNQLFHATFPGWAIGPGHLVSVPVATTPDEALGLLMFPDFSQITNTKVYVAAVTVALVASLETLLNLQAVDNLDPLQRHSPPNRELLAQGVGNMVSGLLGGLPVTSVIVRSSVNIHAGTRSRLSTIFHGTLLVGTVLAVPQLLNSIPLSCLAAILIVTGFKLASPELFRQMWREGRSQVLPFGITVGAIVLTDLLTGILIGLFVAIGFILHGNFRRPLRQFLERHVAGNVLRIELAHQVSFFSRASLQSTLHKVPEGGHVLIDARNTNYIDRDIIDLIDDFRAKTAPAHNVTLSMLGLESHHPELKDSIRFVHHSIPAVQSSLTPTRIIEILREGNERFRSGKKLTRDVKKQVSATASQATPLAVVFSCVDSRTPAELVFDLSIGDIFSVRLAGNLLTDEVLGSMEYGCIVAESKLLVILGHTGCGAVATAVDVVDKGATANASARECEHLSNLVDSLRENLGPQARLPQADTHERELFVDQIARDNVMRVMAEVRSRSAGLRDRLDRGEIGIIGGLYDIRTGTVEFFRENGEVFEAA